MTNDIFTLLLKDAGRLLKPLRVTQIEPTVHRVAPSDETISVSHPHRTPVLVLSDLYDLFSQPSGALPSRSKEGRSNHVAHKLRFYAVHILSMPTLILESLTTELTMAAEKLK